LGKPPLASLLILAALNHASAQVPPQLAARLKAATTALQSARVTATIDQTLNAGGKTHASRIHWATQAGKEHLKVLPGSQYGAGTELLWDGEECLYRPPEVFRHSQLTIVGIQLAHQDTSGPESPMRAGYCLSLGSANSADTPLAEALSKPGVSVLPGPPNRIRLRAPSNMVDGTRVVELAPAWNYMITLDRDKAARAKNRASVTVTELQVLEARQIGGVWVPTKYTLRSESGAGPVGYTSVLGEVSAQVAPTEFATLAQPGETVVDGPTTYLVGADGVRRRSGSSDPNAAGENPARRSWARSVPAVIFGLALTLGAALLIRAVFKVDRPKDAYWGPPNRRP